MSTEICIKLFTQAREIYRRVRRRLLQSSPQSRYMFDIKKLLLIDALKFIPGEVINLLRIAIDLPEGRYLFKDFVNVKRWMDRPLAV